jgi:hypothetical protein
MVLCILVINSNRVEGDNCSYYVHNRILKCEPTNTTRLYISIEQAGGNGNAVDFYSGVVRFDSWLEHQLYWQIFRSFAHFVPLFD